MTLDEEYEIFCLVQGITYYWSVYTLLKIITLTIS